MKRPHLPRLSLLLTLLVGTSALAAENTVIIHAPRDGATLDAMAENAIDYEVIRGPAGDHIHLYVDDKEVAVLRHLKSSYTLPTLAPGERNLCIRMVNKGHTPIGVEQCVKVLVQ